MDPIVPPHPESISEQKQESESIPKIRTLKADAEDFIKQKRVSPLDIATRAYTAQNNHDRITSEDKSLAGTLEKIISWPWLKIGVALLILIVLSGAGYAAYRMFYKSSPTVIEQTPQAPESFVAYDEQKIITFPESNPGVITQLLKKEQEKVLRFGSINYFPIEVEQKLGGKTFVTAPELIDYLGWQAPQDFLDSLNPNFNTLIYYGDKSRDISFIFQINNFDRGLASLFSWEPLMISDLRSIIDQQKIASSTKVTFEDEIIKNHDVRIRKTANGDAILGYTIFDKRFVIISTSREAITAILNRLSKLPPI